MDDDKSIIRTEKTKNYSVISNEVARRVEISARAKGIYYYIMTLPDDWKFYKSEIYSHFTEGRDALNTAFSELEMSGYIKKEKIHDNKGKFDGWKYTVYETVQNVESTESLKNRKSENPKSGNPHLLSTDLLLNTDNTNSVDDFTKEQQGTDSLYRELVHLIAELKSFDWLEKHTTKADEELKPGETPYFAAYLVNLAANATDKEKLVATLAKGWKKHLPAYRQEEQAAEKATANFEEDNRRRKQAEIEEAVVYIDSWIEAGEGWTPEHKRQAVEQMERGVPPRLAISNIQELINRQLLIVV